MTLHSIWGDTPPPGTAAMNTDGGPSISTGHRFYLATNPPGGTIDAVKVAIPTTGAAIPPRVRVKVWHNGGWQDPPTANKVVPITAAAGTWQTVPLDTPIPLAAAGAKINAFVQFEDTSAPGTYQTYYGFNPDQRGNGNAVESATLPGFVWQAHTGGATVDATNGGAFFKSPNDAGSLTSALTSTTGYGIDLVINDHADDEPEEPDPTGPEFGANIVAENALPGTDKMWWYDGLTSEQMPAFGRSTYVAPGATMNFSVGYNSPFTFDVFRLGHYQGNGARRVVQGLTGTPAAQPTPAVIPNSNGAVTCAAWSVNASWAVPADAVPGWYQIVLRGSNGTDFGFVLFCVTDAAAKKPILVVTGDATWHAAYNGFGGNNVYGASKAVGTAGQRALCSTYDKPVITRDHVPQTHFLNGTYPTLKWMESMGYAVGYTTIEQIKNTPSILDGRALIMFTGHNEYVPDAVIDKVKALLAAGQRFANLAGNDMFWRVKFTDGAFDSSADGRVMWCRKDSLDGPTAVRTGGAGTPFTTAADWTGTWQDTRWADREPSEDYFGDRFVANGIRSDRVEVPAAMKASPAWRNCPGIQDLAPGSVYQFAPGTLGMEWDMPIMTNPNVQQVMFSSTEVDLVNVAADINGANYETTSMDTIHGFTMVASGNGVVANFNSDQWGWALDGLHLRGTAPGDANAQQMMLNVLRDLGAVPHTASVTAAGRTAPTPVALSTYGIDVDESVGTPVSPGWYYSGLNGEGWTPVD